jgi:hypothetical protein
MAGRYVAAMVAGNGDRRRVSNTLRETFTGKEREQLHKLALKALRQLGTPPPCGHVGRGCTADECRSL